MGKDKRQRVGMRWLEQHAPAYVPPSAAKPKYRCTRCGDALQSVADQDEHNTTAHLGSR
jgi:hypothetical protein